MEDNKLLKFITNHYLLFGIVLIVLFMLSISTTYAKYIVQTTQKDNHIGTSDCFKLTLEENNNINLDNTIPISDEDGKTLNPYTFTIKNICKNPAKYDVNIEELNSSNIDLNFVKYQLNDDSPSILGSINSNDNLVLDNSKSSYTIASDVLEYNESNTYNLRLWIDENATQTDVENKIFSSKIVIISTLNKKYVYLDAMGGYVDKEKSLLVNNKINELPIPTKDNYEFVGWYTSKANGELVTSDTVFTSETTIYARWQANPYTITYDLDKGVVSSPNPTTYNSKSSFTLNNPQKEGYEFIGWQEEMVDFTWQDGWIAINTGEIQDKNNSYPNAKYTNLVSVRANEKYTVTNTKEYLPGNIRIRSYYANQTYTNILNNNTYTPQSDGYVRILYIENSTDEQLKSATLTSNTLHSTMTINKNSMGNKKYTAKYKEIKIITKEYEDGSTKTGSYRSYNTISQDKVLLEFDGSKVSTPTSLDLDFRCGNSSASVASSCTFKVQGYVDEKWEDITVKSGSRSKYTPSVTIFSGIENVSTDKEYLKYRVILNSNDEQAYVYAKITVS